MGSPVSPVSIHRSSPRLLAPALQDMILHGDLTNTKPKPKPYKTVIFLQCDTGSPVPTKNITKNHINIHQKMWLFMKKKSYA